MKKIITLTLTLILITSILCGCDIRTFENMGYEIPEATTAEGETVPIEEIRAEYKEQQNALHDFVADDQFERITISVGSTIQNRNNFVLFRDTYTDVVYIAIRDTYSYQLSPMLKPDGLPMLYSEWVQLHEGTTTIDEMMATEPVATEPIEEIGETEYVDDTVG